MKSTMTWMGLPTVKIPNVDGQQIVNPIQLDLEVVVGWTKIAQTMAYAGQPM